MAFLIGQKVIICGKAIGTVMKPLIDSMPNTEEDIWVDSPMHGHPCRFSARNVKPYYDVAPLRPVRVMKNDLETYVQGIGYKKVEDYIGMFHGWGTELWEQEEGSVTYSIGLVEKEDGSVECVVPANLRFFS